MKKIWISALAAVVVLAASATMIGQAQPAGQEQTYHKGVYLEEIDLENMTAEQAKKAVEEHLKALEEKKITLLIGSHEVEATAKDFGLTWENEDVLEDALLIGKSGNIIQRYKLSKDLEAQPMAYELEYSFDKDTIETYVNEQCLEFDTEPENASLTRENGEFLIAEGTTGIKLNVSGSVDAIYDYLEQGWNQGDGEITLVFEEQEAEITADQLALVKDVLGSCSTSFSSSTASRSQNLDTGSEKINGAILFPGEVFSVYEVCHPFTVENGYGIGGAFENGKVVDSIGGGICQVSTTLYNAVLRAELEVVERSNHTMPVTYVKPSMDAAIAGTYMDLKFKNNTDAPIYIEGYTYNREIFFNIYGHETRPAGREVRFESEVTGTQAAGVKIEANSSAPIGSISITQNPVQGSTAKLWKIVTENGKETRTQVNSSTYVPSPTIYTVGTAGSAADSAAVQSAIASGDIDHVRAVVNSIGSGSSEPDQSGNEADPPATDPNDNQEPESPNPPTEPENPETGEPSGGEEPGGEMVDPPE